MSPRPAEEHTRTGIYRESHRLLRSFASAADVPAVEFLRRLLANYGPSLVVDLTSPGRVDARSAQATWDDLLAKHGMAQNEDGTLTTKPTARGGLTEPARVGKED